MTSDGVVSRYFFGIEFPPKELELELEQASAGRVGSPIGRLLLLCYDYDQATGKYTLSILRLIRVLGTATAVSLAGFLFVMVRREMRGRRLAVRAGAARSRHDWARHGRRILSSARGADHVELSVVSRASVEPGEAGR